MSQSPIYRYDGNKRDVKLNVSEAPEGWHEVLGEHLKKYIPGEAMVFHEFISTNIHLDLNIFLPTPERPYITVVTEGVSDAPANPPDDPAAQRYRHIELMLYLPPDWQWDFQKLPKDKVDQAYWPFLLLKTLGRFVHEYRSFLLPGNTVPNGGEEQQPYAPGVNQSCALILEPVLEDEHFRELDIKGTPVRFLHVLPISDAETDFKLKRGMQTLLKKFEENGTPLIIAPKRPCVFDGASPSGDDESDSDYDGDDGEDDEPLDAQGLSAALKETRNLLLAARKSFDAATLRSLRPQAPDFVMQEESSPLRCIYRDQELLLTQGRLVWAHIVQANQMLFMPMGMNCPAAVVYAADETLDGEIDRIASVAKTLFQTKGDAASDPELRRFSEIITDEKEMQFNLPIPKSRTDGRALFYTSIVVHTEQMPAPILANSFLPLLILPERTQGSLILPAKYWSPALKARFTANLDFKLMVARANMKAMFGFDDTEMNDTSKPQAKNGPRSSQGPARPRSNSASPAPARSRQSPREEAPRRSGYGLWLAGFIVLAIVVRLATKSSPPPPAPKQMPVYRPPTTTSQTVGDLERETQPFVRTPTMPKLPGIAIDDGNRSPAKLQDDFLTSRADLMIGRMRGGVMIEREGFRFEDSLQKSLESGDAGAEARFVFYALLKFARRADPLYASRSNNMSHPLYVLKAGTIAKDSALGKAFLARVEAKAPGAQAFGATNDFVAAEVLEWWRKNAAEYAYPNLNEWLREEWTTKYVLPKLNSGG